jgi:hypothetical protein
VSSAATAMTTLRRRISARVPGNRPSLRRETFPVVRLRTIRGRAPARRLRARPMAWVAAWYEVKAISRSMHVGEVVEKAHRNFPASSRFRACGRDHPFISESNGSARTPSDAHIAAGCWDLAAAAHIGATCRAILSLGALAINLSEVHIPRTRFRPDTQLDTEVSGVSNNGGPGVGRDTAAPGAVPADARRRGRRLLCWSSPTRLLLNPFRPRSSTPPATSSVSSSSTA